MFFFFFFFLDVDGCGVSGTAAPAQTPSPKLWLPRYRTAPASARQRPPPAGAPPSTQQKKVISTWLNGLIPFPKESSVRTAFRSHVKWRSSGIWVWNRGRIHNTQAEMTARTALVQRTHVHSWELSLSTYWFFTSLALRAIGPGHGHGAWLIWVFTFENCCVRYVCVKSRRFVL